jgi:hypothetical protein
MNARHLYAIGGLTILASLGLGSTRVRGGAPPNSQMVTVANTVANPVPTAAQGTTQVGGTVAVSSLPAVQLSGTPNVNVNSLPAVQFASGSNVAINNDSANPVPVHDPGPAGQTYVSKSIEINFNDGDFGDFLDAYTVPAGKILTIRDVSVVARLTNSEKALSAEVYNKNVAGTFQLYCPLTEGGTDTIGNTWFTGTVSNCSFELGAGSIVEMGLVRSPTTGTASVLLSFNGYLRDAF